MGTMKSLSLCTCGKIVTSPNLTKDVDVITLRSIKFLSSMQLRCLWTQRISSKSYKVTRPRQTPWTASLHSHYTKVTYATSQCKVGKLAKRQNKQTWNTCTLMVALKNERQQNEQMQQPRCVPFGALITSLLKYLRNPRTQIFLQAQELRQLFLQQSIVHTIRARLRQQSCHLV